jgi:hypothetical protein
LSVLALPRSFQGLTGGVGKYRALDEENFDSKNPHEEDFDSKNDLDEYDDEAFFVRMQKVDDSESRGPTFYFARSDT